MKRRLWLAGLVASAAAGTARSETAEQGAARRKLAIELSKELRDPSSANQTLYESESAISGELKAEIYAQLAKGKTREEVLEFFAERYGDSIRYDPAMKTSTAALWAAPWLLIAIAGTAAFMRRRRRSK